MPITNSVLLLASEIAGILNWVFTLPCLFLYIHNIHYKGLPSGKEPTCQCRRHKRWGWIPGLGRSLRGGPGNPLQCSCLENPMDTGAWRATVHRVAKSQTELKWNTTPITKRFINDIYTCSFAACSFFPSVMFLDLTWFSRWFRKSQNVVPGQQHQDHREFIGNNNSQARTGHTCVLFAVCLVPKSCPALLWPMNCSLPGLSVHGVA